MGWLSDLIGGAGQVIQRTIGDPLGLPIFGPSAEQRAGQIQTQNTGLANRVLSNAFTSSNRAISNYGNAAAGQFYDYKYAGGRALRQLFDNNVVGDIKEDPSYNFRFKEGERALQNASAARGLLNSGRTLKALTRYGQDYASTEYDKAYQRNYQRLAHMADLGFNARSNIGNIYQNIGQMLGRNQSNYGVLVSNNLMGLGNALAASEIGGANRISNLLGSGITAAGAYYGMQGGPTVR